MQCKRQAASPAARFLPVGRSCTDCGVLSLNRYVNTVVKPTLHELAEYEARSAAVQAMNRAVAAELTRSPALCDALLHRAPGLSVWTPQPPGPRRPNLSAPCRPRWTLCRRSAMPSRSAV
ncbi:hypothetical protein NIA69_15280 [Gemmiger formicilis]|nr:hypothetical protein [Gemmiger formicilis]